MVLKMYPLYIFVLTVINCTFTGVCSKEAIAFLKIHMLNELYNLNTSIKFLFIQLLKICEDTCYFDLFKCSSIRISPNCLLIVKLILLTKEILLNSFAILATGP